MRVGCDYHVPGMSFGEFLDRCPDPEQAFLEQYKYHEGTVWFCARPRMVYGTIEVRPACAQDINESCLLPAVVLGIIENLEDARAFVDQFFWKEWVVLRRDAITHGFHAKMRAIPVYELARELVRIAELGLKKRHKKEEVILTPLYERVSLRENPAILAISRLKRGGIKALVEETMFIPFPDV